jgi:uncharacterized protein (UPF0332 family)
MQQKKGIELVEPSNNLHQAYLLKAEEALVESNSAASKSWKLVTAYYAIYYGVYSLLMKMGVKSEIHSCTIEFAKRALKAHLSLDDFKLIDRAFEARNDSQYYVNRQVPQEGYEMITGKTPGFLVKCKNIVLEEKEILEKRNALAADSF